MSKPKSDYWLGGYVRDNEGKATYIIRKRIEGKQYEVSTRCHTESGALEQLKRFEANPANFSPGGPEKKQPLHLDRKLREDDKEKNLGLEFLAYCRDVKKNSPGWVSKQKRYVAWWTLKLKGVDLRTASLVDHIDPALLNVTAKAHRIATVKAIYSWLRTVRRALTASEDCTLKALVVPQSDPNARIIKNKAVPREHYLLAREHLVGHWRDALDLQAGTGWHISEVQRFALSGDVEPYPKKGGAEGVAGVLVCPETKDGGSLRTPVSAEVLEAGKRLLKRGSFDVTKYGLAVKAACAAAKLKGKAIFTPGRLRHSVATWAINEGADPGVVSAFLNHKNPRTTRKFYATHAVPLKVPTLL